MDKIQQKVQSGREYRDLQLNIVEVESEEPSYRVEGYATTYNQPYHLYTVRSDDGDINVYEQVDKKAFDNADLSDVIMQYDHQGRVFARQSNGTLNLDKDDEKGLKIDADLGGTTIGRELYEEIKGGYTNKMSFGFIVGGDNLQDVSEKGEIKYLRTITRIDKVFDVSAVSLPANDATEISARAYVDGVIAEVEAERQKLAEMEARKAELETRIKSLKGAQ